MTTIRPNLPPATPPSAPARQSDAARLAARAFFEIAAGKPAAPAPAAAAPVRPAASAAPAPAAAPQSPLGTDRAEPAQRALRPGSLLDIRV